MNDFCIRSKDWVYRNDRGEDRISPFLVIRFTYSWNMINRIFYRFLLFFATSINFFWSANLIRKSSFPKASIIPRESESWFCSNSMGRDSCSKQIFKGFRDRLFENGKNRYYIVHARCNFVMLTILWCIAHRLAVNRIWLWYCATKLFVQKKKFVRSNYRRKITQTDCQLIWQALNTGVTTI